MVMPELAREEALEWNEDSTLREMWSVVRQCRKTKFDKGEIETVVNWYVFLKMHNVAMLEEFLQKFAEGAKEKNFYKFSKYCLALYRKIHMKQLGEIGRGLPREKKHMRGIPQYYLRILVH